MMNAAIYIRVSTKPQAERFGLLYQENIAKVLIARNGWNFTKTYEDRGLSGSCGPDVRAGLRYLLEDAASKLFDKLVIYSVDRLGRSQDVIENIYDELTKHNVEIVSCTEVLKDQSPVLNKTVNNEVDKTVNNGVNKMLIIQYALQGELEVQTIRQRMLNGKKERMKIDGECGGDLPYGYVRFDNKIVVDPFQARVINGIYDAYYNRKMFVAAIVRSLDNEKIPSPKGINWNKTTVTKIISYEDKYNGGFRNGSLTRWPVILTKKYH